jgi:hypothetical protein
MPILGRESEWILFQRSAVSVGKGGLPPLLSFLGVETGQISERGKHILPN